MSANSSPAKLPWHSGCVAEEQEPQDGIKVGLCVVAGQSNQQRSVMHPPQRVHAPLEAQLLRHLYSQVLRNRVISPCSLRTILSPSARC